MCFHALSTPWPNFNLINIGACALIGNIMVLVMETETSPPYNPR